MKKKRKEQTKKHDFRKLFIKCSQYSSYTGSNKVVITFIYLIIIWQLMVMEEPILVAQKLKRIHRVDRLN